MKRIVKAVVFVSFGAPLLAAGGSRRMMEAARPVYVCLEVGAAMKPQTLLWGESAAHRIFEQIGVRLEWSCAPERDPIRARIVEDGPPDLAKGALAYAFPFAREGVRVVVVYERCRPLLAGDEVAAGAVLGHVLAHELGHVLARLDGHAPAGVMRARWTADDLSVMRMRLLAFTPEEAHIIRANLAMETAAAAIATF